MTTSKQQTQRENKMKINLQGIKDNAQHFAGVIIGLCILKPFNLRFSKEHRGQCWFSTVAANIAASDAVGIEFFPFNVFYK